MPTSNNPGAHLWPPTPTPSQRRRWSIHACGTPGRQEPCRVEEEEQLGSDVQKGREQRAEQAAGGEADAQRIHGQRAGEVLPDDPARALGDGQRLDKFGQVIP